MNSDDIKSDGFTTWHTFEMDISNEKYPGCFGVYALRQKGGEKRPYKIGESDIIKIGAAEKPLACRMWDYLNSKIIKNPDGKTVTAWKIRDFMKYREIEVAFKCTSTAKEAKKLEKELNKRFRSIHGEKPLLEGSVEEYRQKMREYKTLKL